MSRIPFVLLGAAAMAVGTLSAGTFGAAIAAPGGSSATHAQAPTGPAKTVSVTLITGDVVRVRTAADGRRSITLAPDGDGLIPKAAISQVKGHLYVVPESAFALLSAQRLDLDLFDVNTLIESGYDDAHRSTLPVMVDYGHGATAAREARTSTLAAGERTVTVPALGVTAYAADKRDAGAFWDSLTAKPDATGAPTALADGATRVDLDGKVSVSLEDSVPQIHAPEAWAAGYNGAGVKVAVLDTGYDPTHPDLAGVVDEAVNFTEDASAVDGNGHGTHVASTVAGSGAASSGLRKGVAPGAHLLIGKVLDHSGSGQDSMVLAGMQWAVAQGADVISMSLGGDTTDGTDPLSQAVNELSESSDSLFVIAAGNNGNAGPSTVSAPGAASDALTVGAVDVNDHLADFSSRGPRYGDGAVKPEVVAPGVDVTAARAAGTSLGNVVDQYYTSLDGTSMATPHVAGVAAILKQKHPNWTGERLKAVIAGSSVPIAGTTPFESGDGRVDALAAINQDVLSDAVVDLGFYKWPHDTLPVTHHALTYTNLGSTPVTLSLAPPADLPGVTLESSTLTVPAGGDASVDVALDPTVAGTGSFAGVVEATPDDGGVPVRTTLSYGLEDERYDLTVNVLPRPGTQSASHIVGLAGLDNWNFEQRTLDKAPGAQSVTWRIAPGVYTASSLSFGLAADEAQEGIMTFAKHVDVHADTTVTLDEGETSRFGYRTARPAVSDGLNMMAEWADDATGGYAGYMITGNVDRLYAQPEVAPEGGTINSSLNWMLTQPEGDVQTATGQHVAVRPLTKQGQNAWDANVADQSLRARVVDAGSSTAPDVSGVSGAIAVVAGDCSDLTGTAQMLADAGAKAMVAYPGDGAECAGTLAGTSPLPSLQVRPFLVERLLAGGAGSATLVTRRNPAYVYDLEDAWSGEIPAGSVLDGTSASVARLDEHVKSLGTPTTAVRGNEMLIGWIPDRGIAAFGLVRPVRLPSAVTHYISEGAEWERVVQVVAVRTGGLLGELTAPKLNVTAGSTRKDTWFGGPITTYVSPQSTAYGWQGQPNRQGDDLWINSPPWVDDAGHWGAVLYLDEYKGSLWIDGDPYFTGEDPMMFNGIRIPSGKHRIAYRVETNRTTPFWQRSTHTATRWEFDSAQPKGAYSRLPLMQVDYNLPLADRNTAAAGDYRVGIGFKMPPAVKALPVVKATVQLSWNGGQTWRSLSINKCFSATQHRFASTCWIPVHNPTHGSASLRVLAEDAAGRSVRQTVIDAYRVR